jgi:hypothetical protein
MNSPIDNNDQPASERERLEQGVKQIVTSYERTPRDPRWRRAWWRTLVRYNRRLGDLRRQEAGDALADEP